MTTPGRWPIPEPESAQHLTLEDGIDLCPENEFKRNFEKFVGILAGADNVTVELVEQ